MVEFCSAGDEPFAIADPTDAYRQNGALRVRHGVKLVDRRARLVQDELTFRAPSELWWFMHTRAEIDVAPGGLAATLSQNCKHVQVFLLARSKGAKLVAMDAVHLASSPGPTAGERGAEGARKLAIVMEDVTELRLAIALVPRDGGDAPVWQIVPLSAWSA